MPAIVLHRDQSHLGYIDLNKNEMRNMTLQNLGSDIASPVDGLIFYRSDTDKVRVRMNGVWQDLATMADVTAGGISSSIFDAKGDIIVATAADTAVRKAVGTDGQLLFADSAQADGLLWRDLTETDIKGVTTDRLLGRDTAATGAAEEISVGGGLEFTGSAGIQRSALTGDITASAGSGTTAIAAGVIVDADVNASAGIAATKLSVTATDRILGRDTAAAGAVEELTVTGGLEFTGSGGIQRSALTGDVTAAAGSNTTAIAAGVIVDADVNASAAIAVTKTGFSTTDRLLGRDTAGAGAGEEISLNATLEFTGSTSIQRAALTGDITAAAGSNTTAIAAGVIVDADVNASAAIAATKLAFSPTGNIAATTVQGAIAELETDLTALISSTVQGQIWKNPVDAATTGALPNTPTYNSGAGTLTANTNAAFPTTDGVTAAAGQDYLVKDQASTFQDGIYTLTTLGSGAAPWVLTRRADSNTNTELQDAAVMVEAGTVNRGRVYTQVNAIADLTSAAQSWVLTNENQVYTGSSTITLTGQAFSVTANSISETHLTTSVAGNGLTGGNGTPVAVGAGTGITVNANDVALAATTAGAGLTHTTGVLAVGAGNGITVNADDVALASSTAGNGLTYTTGVLAVGAGDGISVAADAVSVASTIAGGGLTFTTGVVAVGAGNGISVAADAISVDTAVVARKASGTLSGGSNSEVLTHNLGTRDVKVMIRNNASPWDEIEVYNESTTTNTTTVYAGAGQNLPASYTWKVIG
jgi:hypothetical protein